MQVVNRIAHCSNCGGDLFKIKPGPGYAYYYCAECSTELTAFKYNKYETTLPICKQCGGDVFKVRVIDDEGDSLHEFCDTECVSCKGAPELVYVDSCGNLINEGERELLIKKDRIAKLEQEIEAKNDTITQLEDKINDLNNEIEEKDKHIHYLEDGLEVSQNQIIKLENCISDLEWETIRIG